MIVPNEWTDRDRRTCEAGRSGCGKEL